MNRSDLDHLSHRMLADQFPAYLIMISLCPFFFATNIFIIATIYNTKSLRTKSLWLVCSLSVVDILISLIYFTSYIRRVILYFLRIPDTSTHYVCFWIQLPVNLSADIEQIMILGLAIDRFLCIMFPIFYKTVRTLPYVLTFNGVCLGIEALMAISAYVTRDGSNPMVVGCDRITSFGPKFLALQNAKVVIFLALIIVTYFILAVIMYRRYKTAKVSMETKKSSPRRQLDFDIFFATVLIGGISAVIYGAFILSVLFDSKSETASTALIISAISVSAHAMSCFFVYFKVNKQFRKAFFIVVCRRSKIEQTKVQVLRSSGVGVSSTGRTDQRC